MTPDPKPEPRPSQIVLRLLSPDCEASSLATSWKVLSLDLTLILALTLGLTRTLGRTLILSLTMRNLRTYQGLE